MIREKRNDAYGRQMLRVDCGGWESYREAVSYIVISKYQEHMYNQRKKNIQQESTLTSYLFQKLGQVEYEVREARHIQG